MNKKKKILVPIFNRAHYGRLRSVLRAIKQHPSLELELIVAIPAAYRSIFTTLRHSRPNSWVLAIKWYIRARILYLLSKFSYKLSIESDFLLRNLENDGFKVSSRIPLFLDGGSPEIMLKMVGLGLIHLAEELKRLKPDTVFVNADRFEMMAVALAASYLNIPIAHNEGGDVSGTIDESIRHAITKLSHLHFVSSQQSYKRVKQMGENPENIFMVGSPAIDAIAELSIEFPSKYFPEIKPDIPYLLVLMHPVATESDSNNITAMDAVADAIGELNMQTIFVGSNIDAGSKHLGLALREWIARNPSKAYVVKNLPPDKFYSALAQAACAIGNSSSFIREGAYFGTPVVLVGSRQTGREKGENIIEVLPSKEKITKAVKEQLAHGRYSKDIRFGAGNAGEKIANILAETKSSVQKKFFDQ